MIDYFLKFENKQQAVASFTEVNGITPEGTFVQATHGWAIDPIGEIQKRTGKMIPDNEGGQYAEIAPVPGYHVNVRMVQGDLPASLVPFIVTPTSPSRVFG